MVALKRKSYAELDRQLRFESLLVEISTLFINLPADEIDSRIEEVQCRICEFLDIDRSTLWQFQEHDPKTLLLTHIYQPPGSRPTPERTILADLFPWVYQKIVKGETVTVSKIADLPAEATRDKENLVLYGAKSGIYVPLSIGRGPVFGALTFATMREQRDWPEGILKGCVILAQVFANTLARKKNEIALRENEARLVLTTNAAEAGLWDMELDTGEVWVTDKTRDLFHFAPDEKINAESFFN
ncbi:MAG: hypothetical protein IH612_05190, partial [Desulfofustis sp.]|nr:hypothetical protein [Desulfofustis sp.]